LILANPSDPVWVANLVPTSPVINLPAEPQLDDLIVSALKNRPEVARNCARSATQRRRTSHMLRSSLSRRSI